MDSSCLRTTLNWDLAKMRSNSLSTRGCGERMQTVSFEEVRFVVTVRQIIENWPKGQVLWCVCSRIVTDSHDAGLPGTSFNRISTMRFAVWPSQRGGMRPLYPFLPAHHEERRQCCPDRYQPGGQVCALGDVDILLSLKGRGFLRPPAGFAGWLRWVPPTAALLQGRTTKRLHFWAARP